MGGLTTILIVAFVAWALSQRRSGGARSLDVLLAEAERDGVITGDQRRALLERAGDDGPRVQISGVTWLAILAGLFVLAGISLLIATNWEDIGPEVRIVAFLALLLLVGEAALRAKGAVTGAALELVWLVLPLLGIGLYAQTFQLSGETSTSLLVWLVLGVPLAWKTEHPVVSGLHTAAVALLALVGSFLVSGPLSIVGPFEITHWGLAIAVLVLAIAQIAVLLPEDQKHQSYGLVAAWTMGVLIATPPFGLEDGGWIAVAAVSLTTIWLVALLHAKASASELVPALTVWLGILYAMSFAWHLDDSLEGDTTRSALAATMALVALAVAGIARLGPNRYVTDPQHLLGARVLLIAPLALSFTLLLGETAIHAAAIVANVLLGAVAVAFLWHGSNVRSAAEINLGIAVLLVVLVTRFLDVFGSFVQSGVGFIVTGVLLAGLAVALERTRRRLLGSTTKGPTS